MAQINTDEWRAELDMLMVGAKIRTPIVTGHGFTLYDLMAHSGLSRTRAHEVVKVKVKAGTFKHIGYRPTKNGPKVYEMVDFTPKVIKEQDGSV